MITLTDLAACLRTASFHLSWPGEVFPISSLLCRRLWQESWQHPLLTEALTKPQEQAVGCRSCQDTNTFLSIPGLWEWSCWEKLRWWGTAAASCCMRSYVRMHTSDGIAVCSPAGQQLWGAGGHCVSSSSWLQAEDQPPEWATFKL